LKKSPPVKKSRLIILALAVIIPLFFAVPRYYRLASARREEARLKRSILILEAEKEAIRRRIEEYKKGTVLEAKARDDLGMIKEGEKVFLIKNEKDRP
jgi:cell division protein FtsB